jgi:bacterial/archaeal transporter family protein
MRSNLLLIAAMILWGVWGFGDKNAVLRAHPYTVQWMYSLPYLIFIPLWYWLGSRIAPATNLDGRAFLWAALASLASMAALLLLLFALQQRPASIAVAITSAYPVVTLILSVWSGAESFSLPKLVGIAFVLVGVVILLNVPS